MFCKIIKKFLLTSYRKNAVISVCSFVFVFFSVFFKNSKLSPKAPIQELLFITNTAFTRTSEKFVSQNLLLVQASSGTIAFVHSCAKS